MLKHFSVLLAITSTVTCGCERLSKSKADVLAKYGAILKITPASNPVLLTGAQTNGPYTVVTVGGSKLRVPAFRSKSSDDDPNHVVLSYDDFVVLVYIPATNDTGLSALSRHWGADDFERHRSIYLLSERDVRDAKSEQRLTQVIAGLALKGTLLDETASDRFVEFHARPLRGFISGGVELGSPRVRFDCFPARKSDHRMMILTFGRFSREVRDANLAEFVMTIATADKSSMEEEGESG